LWVVKSQAWHQKVANLSRREFNLGYCSQKYQPPKNSVQAKTSRSLPDAGRGNMYWRTTLAPEVRTLASDVFYRSWDFIERDPVLAGHDRQSMQEQLAELILLLMASGERNMIVLANQAIGTLRQQYSIGRDRLPVEQAA
jgi:hypothetical protein